MSKIAIIPARGGSKRIPRKNIKDFLGKPIIAYSIEAALKSGVFDEVMVSTDDEEIAAVSRHYGASVPFLRSTEASNDYATTSEVLLEVLNEYKKQNIEFDYGCCIYPTAPLLRSNRLKEAFLILTERKFDSVFPVVRFGYPIWRSLKIENGHALMNWPEHLNTRSQDLPASYHDVGQFYCFKVSAFMWNHKIFSANTGAIELPEIEVQDIDNSVDWQLAEIKFNLLSKD